MARISVNALQCVQNNKTFYLATLNSDLLKEMCFVTRKKEDPQKGFQRLLSEKRAKNIAIYMDEEKGVIPSALILSAQDNASIRYDKTKSKLSFEKATNSLMVIDGQHRLFGFYESKESYEIPVIIFANLTTTEEVKLFIDINTTQKGVPTALILDIKNQAGTETKLEEKQRELFDKLNNDSVLAGFLLPNESKTGKISRTVFNSSTKQIFENGVMASHSLNIIYNTVKNYLEAIDRVFKETENPNAKINKTIIFKAIFAVFNEVCEKCLLKYKDLKVESLLDCVSPLSELNFDEYIGTNKATETKIINDIRKLLRDPIQIDEGMF